MLKIRGSIVFIFCCKEGLGMSIILFMHISFSAVNK